MSVELNHLQDSYILSYFESLDCSRSLAACLLWKHKEHKQLVELTFNPKDYNDFATARDSLAATKFLSKAKFLQTGNDLAKVAERKFLESEVQCAETNLRIKSGNFLEKKLTESVLLGMTFKIDKILGSFTPDEFVDGCNWGPGATTAIKHRFATAPNKFGSENRITTEAHVFVKDWFHLAYPEWDLQFEIQNEAKIVTVPKDAKSDRVIAIEPGLNLWFQKGIGCMIRKRLKGIGVDLKKQDHNQEKSRIASKFNDFATVDFSSASDTVSKELVRSIFPIEWLNLLRVFRSPSGNLNGESHTLEKISSMGNGFTFELESLIFYTMAVATCDHLGISSDGCSVYGDDVILPAAAYEAYARVSKDLGFTVNLNKSYSDSYYRESCGAHYWNGRDIKPIFQKETFNGRTEILKSANSIRRYAHRRSNCGCDATLRKPWLLLAGYLGPKTPIISEGYGDIGLIDNINHPWVSYVRANNGYEGYFVRCWVFLADKREFDGQGLYLTKIKGIGSLRSIDDYTRESIEEACGLGNSIPLPGQSQLARKRVLIHRWYDLGEWF